MKLSLKPLAFTLGLLGMASTASAADIVVMKFVSDDCQTCAPMESQVDTAVAMVGQDAVKSITIDVSNAALWTRGAHDSFNADVVPVFNKYVGLTGFTAIVDPKSRKVIGCVNNNYDANQIAEFIKSAARIPHSSSANLMIPSYDFKQSRQNMPVQKASVRIENFRCPPAYNRL